MSPVSSFRVSAVGHKGTTYSSVKSVQFIIVDDDESKALTRDAEPPGSVRESTAYLDCRRFRRCGSARGQSCSDALTMRNLVGIS